MRGERKGLIPRLSMKNWVHPYRLYERRKWKIVIVFLFVSVLFSNYLSSLKDLRATIWFLEQCLPSPVALVCVFFFRHHSYRFFHDRLKVDPWIIQLKLQHQGVEVAANGAEAMLDTVKPRWIRQIDAEFHLPDRLLIVDVLVDLLTAVAPSWVPEN